MKLKVFLIMLVLSMIIPFVPHSTNVSFAETLGDADLKVLMLDEVPILNPQFSPNVTSYNAKTYVSIKNIHVYPIAAKEGAVVKVNNISPDNNGRVNVPVTLGSNVITIQVTNGSASKTYTVNVTKVNTDYRGRTPLAAGQVTATATSAETGFPASNIVDGNESTLWTPAALPSAGNYPTIVLTLDQVYTPTRVSAKFILPPQEIGPSIVYTNIFKISVSLDNVNWTDVAKNAKLRGAADGTSRYEFIDFYKAKYIKFEMTSYNSIVKPSLKEMTVYVEDESKIPQAKPAPAGGDQPFVPDDNPNLSRASKIILEKGFQIGSWSPSASYGRGIYSPDEFDDINLTGPMFYDPPLENAKFMKYNPDAQWSLAKAPWGNNGMGAAGEPRDFIPDEMKPYIRNAVDFTFGDEGPYSPDENERFKKWFDWSKAHYPGVLVNSNQCNCTGWTTNMGTYMQAAQPDMLSFDRYIWKSKESPASWEFPNTMLNMGLFKTQRELALKGYDGTGQKPIVFGQYLSSYGFQPSESQKFAHANISVATGMKWLNYFRTEYELDNVWLFDHDGTPTRGFHEVAEINRRIGNWSDYIIRLNNDWVVTQPGKHKDGNGNTVNNNTASGWHLSSFANNSAKNAEYHIQQVSATNLGKENNGLAGDAVLGYFKALPGIQPDELQQHFGATSPKAFMVVNSLTSGPHNQEHLNQDRQKDHGFLFETQQEINLTLQGHTAPLKKVNRDTGAVENVPLVSNPDGTSTLKLTLGGGEAELFFWAENAVQSTSTVTINDTQMGDGVNRFHYEGRWAYREPGPAFPTTVGNDIHFMRNNGDSLTLNFYGTKLELYARRHIDGGVATISIDGGAPADVDTYVASGSTFPVIYTSPVLSNAMHKATITFDKSKGAGSSQRKSISIDGARITYNGAPPQDTANNVIETIVDNTSTGSGLNQFTFTPVSSDASTGWKTTAQTSGTNSGDTSTTKAGASYEFKFYGTDVSIYAPSNINGTTKFYLDGVELSDHSMIAGSENEPVLRKTIHASNSNAWHTLRVEAVSGTTRVDHVVVKAKK